MASDIATRYADAFRCSAQRQWREGAQPSRGGLEEAGPKNWTIPRLRQPKQ